MRLAILGTGLMGNSASARLKDLGFHIVLWNRSIEKTEVIARDLGVDIARSIVEAINSVDYALAFLADDSALLSVVSSIPRADGLIFVNFSTVTPKASIMASEFLSTRGVCYVEAPILGGPRIVREGKAIILVSGPSHCVGSIEGILKALASDIIFISEDIGKASALKLAYNNMLITSIASLAESIVLAEAYGLSLDIVKNVFSKTVFKDLVERYFDRLISEEIPTGFKLSLAAKDMEYASRAAFDKGIPLPLASAVEQLYMLASKAGLGDKDYTRIYLFMKRLGLKT
ncbi:MAG: NAD(P)-dependent oxidoreductase [Acidilobaceae archaeon]